MYINLLIKLKNAQAVKKESVKAACSKMEESILEVLSSNGYIAGFEKKGKGVKRIFDIQLKYNDKEGAINGIKFISKPSRKIYAGYKDIKPVKSGHGLFVISTPEGILSGREAQKKKVGGEALFQIW